jgi:putative transcriptional regulator
MTPIRHPPDDLLLSYAAGTCAEPVALVVGTHVAMCPTCRGTVALLNELGGALFETIEPAMLQPDSLEKVLDRIQTVAAAEPQPVVVKAAGTESQSGLPGSIARHFPQGLETAAWKHAGPKIEVTRILRHCEGFVTRVVRLQPGTRIPRHSHTGMELTLVLSGGFAYEGETYREGDFGEADEHIHHRLVVDTDEPCVCLVTESGPIALAPPWGWLVNPLIRLLHTRF